LVRKDEKLGSDNGMLLGIPDGMELGPGNDILLETPGTCATVGTVVVAGVSGSDVGPFVDTFMSGVVAVLIDKTGISVGFKAIGAFVGAAVKGALVVTGSGTLE